MFNSKAIVCNFSKVRLNEMSERHKKLFGVADYKDQFKRFCEEFSELLEANFFEMDENHAIEEAADCYIAIAGLYNSANESTPYRLLQLLNCFYNHKIIEEAALRKMAINESERIFVDGRHVKFPVYPDDKRFVNLPDGAYICKCNKESGSNEALTIIQNKYLPLIFDYVVKPFKGQRNE